MAENTDTPTHSVDDILMPLAIAVVIDHKVRQLEETAFVTHANGLLELFGHDTKPDADILRWFAERKVDLEDQLWDKGGNTLVLKSLTRFDEAHHREAVFDALVSISIADNEYVTEESRLIKSAASLYGFQRPPLKVKRD
ncbi:hypothetical protein ACFFUB_12430 [Algimonas porphyrae]|uniref:Co-chaperone DjlA N-terminal domain-containing protein n=1 Tax=Algimonas porphyrae TaxID=1128113 RepID=A0ABQ5UVM8_9PROT|nr:hypothetical protein [Algimonas porphyrae]GLQ19216.1 hypothetical protein GCM10007854_01710 [Algimonas porphyrae]